MKKFTDRVDLRCSHEVWCAFKAKDIHGVEFVRIEFVDGSALEVRPSSFNGTLMVKEFEA